jgi:hypothetical protein
MNIVINYLSQQSTWKGIIAILTFCGATLNQEQATSIISAGIALIGVINVFRNEKKEG